MTGRRFRLYGHSLSVSDVIELYDEEANEFYYVDYRDFKPVAFGDRNRSNPRCFSCSNGNQAANGCLLSCEEE